MSETPTPYELYLSALREPFHKLCRLRFLNPDGTVAFALDNRQNNARSSAFISSGNINVSLQNGVRRTATITLSNVDHAFDYDIEHLWFGQAVALDEGMILPDGTDFYIPQGVFLLETPEERFFPDDKTITYNLVDKWAMLDGTLYGNLESTYEVPVGTNIYEPITALLEEDIGNGMKLDPTPPVYTDYYDGKTQELPDGTIVSLTDTAYTLRVDSDSGTLADVIIGLSGMVNALIGYDRTGALRIDPSQDDILDTTKPVAWQFSLADSLFLSSTYTVKNTQVYNDYIVVGEMLDTGKQPRARAQNTDPQSPTNIKTIGRKTIRVNKPGFATDKQCEDYAVWQLKRSSILQKSVTISCGQIFHIDENELVEIVRTDKENAPIERHLVLGFSRPLSETGPMEIEAVSVNDILSEATVVQSD